MKPIGDPYSLANYLQILFVDLNPDPDEIFCQHSRVWEMINKAGQLSDPIQTSSSKEFYLSLYRNNFGCYSIDYDNQSLMYTDKETRKQFKDLVVLLRPQLLVVVGKDTYELLFDDQLDIEVDDVEWGLSDLNIDWMLRKKRRGKTFVFLMSEDEDFEEDDYNNCLEDMTFLFRKLNEFRRKFPTIPPKTFPETTKQEVKEMSAHEAAYKKMHSTINDRIRLRSLPE